MLFRSSSRFPLPVLLSAFCLYGANPERVALRAMAERGQPSLAVARTDTLGGLRFVRLARIVDGVPVHGAEFVVGVDGRGSVFTQAGQAPSQRELPACGDNAGKGPAPPQDEAVKSALAANSIRAFGTPLVERVWVPDEDCLKPAWRVRAATLDPPGDWEILVDAQNASVLDAARSLQSADGTVFVRSPALAAPQRTALSNLLEGGTLSGRFATVTTGYAALFGSGAGAAQLARADADGNFLYGISDPRFAEVQLYYGIDLAHTRFRELGFQLLERPLDGVVYSPQAVQQGPFYLATAFEGRGGIFFAPLSPRHVDPALDLDVVFHEYAHAVITAIAGMPRSRGFAAISEGFADYFAASFSDDANFGEHTSTAFGPPGSQLRFLLSANQYPRDLVSEAHQLGLIWAAALWDVRRELGAAQADRIAMAALLSLTASSDFLQAGGAAVSAANALYSAGPRVRTIMERRGILPSAEIPSFSDPELRSGIPQPGSIQAGSADSCLLERERQYRITVPPGARELQVVVRAERPLELFVRYRRPVFDEGGPLPVFDYRFPSELPGGGIIRLDSSPELQAGIYYLAVRNCGTARTEYQVFAEVFGGSPDAVWTTDLSPGAAVSGVAPQGPTMNSRQFTFTVPANAASVRFNLQGTGNVDLYAAHNRPVAITDLGMPMGDAFSAGSGASETLTLTRLTVPNLRPGTYYLAVFNRDSTSAVRFNVSANVVAASADPTPETPLTPGVAMLTSAPAALTGLGTLSPQQYSILVPPNARRLTITANTIGDILVGIRHRNSVAIEHGRPVGDYFFHTSRGSTIEITPGSHPPLESSSVYYVALLNFTSGPVAATLSYTVEVADVSPRIRSGDGVVHGAAFTTPISENCWISILGSNLATTTRSWGASDFVGGRLPTQLDGVSVIINGRPAYVAYISPTQINALTAADPSEGTVEVRVLTTAGQTPATLVQKARIAPALFTLDAGGATRYASAVHPDGTLAGRAGLFGPAVTTKPGRPGDRLLLFGAGFGAVVGGPGGGSVFSGAAPLVVTPRVRIGGVDAVVEFAGLVSNGLYQFNVIVPDLASDDHLVEIIAEGFATQPFLYLTVER